MKREDLLLHRQLYLHGAQAPLPPPPALRASDLEEFAIQFCCPGCSLPLTVQDCQADVAVTCGCGRQFDMADVLKLFPGKYPPRCLLCDESCEDHDAMETHLNERHAAGGWGGDVVFTAHLLHKSAIFVIDVRFCGFLIAWVNSCLFPPADKILNL